MTIKNPALKYYGGKFRLADWILKYFPKHIHYVEPFGGGASVLLQKEPATLETYNDRDGDVVNFFSRFAPRNRRTCPAHSTHAVGAFRIRSVSGKFRRSDGRRAAIFRPALDVAPRRDAPFKIGLAARQRFQIADENTSTSKTSTPSPNAFTTSRLKTATR